MSKIRLATDVGGTFTDLVFYEIDEKTRKINSVKAVKSHTTPPNFEEGVMDAVAIADVDLKMVEFFAHGTTVVINALMERKGVKTGLITTKGFRDILEIGRGNRPDFFNIRYAKPEPFVPRYLRREIDERMTYKGDVVHPLDLGGLADIVRDFKSEGVEAIAICLLHSYANPEHEQKLAKAVQALWPEVSIVSSHQITREWREYERTNTAVLSAYVQPIANDYLTKMEDRLQGGAFTGSFYVMQSNGGIDTIKAAKSTPITMVESGPASGVLGAAALGKIIGVNNILALDIGGTTAKCSLIDNGRVEVTSQYMIERSHLSSGYPIMTPVVDLVEIGNGGGSIAWIDDDNKLHVGPHSAGAKPGPVAYGKGGTELTTTDANLMLARINPDYFIGGEITADMPAVETAFTKMGAKLGLSAAEAARGVIKVANHSMTNALKLVSINRGYDPRDFTMVAFGGGGAMHATALAMELGVPKVIVPAHSAVFSAWGMLMSDLRRDYIRTQPMPFTEAVVNAVNHTVTEMESEALGTFQDENFENEKIYFERYFDMRYEGQEHSVRIPVPNIKLKAQDMEEILVRFHEAYEREYTYRLDVPVELVTFHLVAFGSVERPELSKLTSSGTLSAAQKGLRMVDFDELGVKEAAIYNRDLLAPGISFTGPAVIEESGTTTVVFPNQTVDVDDYGNLHITL